MSEGIDQLKSAWRDFVSAGVPASGANEPNKSEIRAGLDSLALDIAAAAASTAGDGIEEIVGAVRPIVDDGVARSLVVSETLVGAPAALPIGGNPNDLITSVPDADNEQPFEVLIVDTNTGPAWLEANGFRRAIGRDGAGTDTVAGDLTKGKVATFQYSAGGGRFILTGVRDIESEDTAPSNTYDPDFALKPWGTVTISGGTRTVTPVEKFVLVPGSSNADTDYVPAAQLPALVAAAELNSAFPAGDTLFTGKTVAVEGSPWSAIFQQLDTSPEFLAGQVSWVIPFFWMNDARTVFYHSQGGVTSIIGHMRNAAKTIRAKGAELVFVTGFHPDMRSPSIALDPNWFSDTTDMGGGVTGATSAMVFPAAKSAPVNPETQMYPPASAQTIVRDWTGNGLPRTGYRRVWHVNRLIREIAAELGCVLLDLEHSSYANAIETVPDLGAGLDTFYDSSNPLHPKPALYDAAVTPVLRQWAQAVAAGRTDRRVFTGVA